MKITILSGTDRPGSRALQISRHVKSAYERHGVEAEVVSLEDFPVASVVGGRYGEAIREVEAFRSRVIDTDGIVMVVPEYNGSFPGILKLFIDYLPFPEALMKKPMAFIGEAAGAFGALRAVEQMQMICAYRNAHIYPERIFLQRVNSIFDHQKGITDPVLADLMEKQVAGFIRFIASVERNL